jgi:hypothetical protein
MSPTSTRAITDAGSAADPARVVVVANLEHPDHGRGIHIAAQIELGVRLF